MKITETAGNIHKNQILVLIKLK